MANGSLFDKVYQNKDEVSDKTAIKMWTTLDCELLEMVKKAM